MNEPWGICQVLSWIAFRKNKFLTDDPHKLRADMKRYSKQVIEPNPAADFLRYTQSGDVGFALKRDPITMATTPMTAVDFLCMTEADVWKWAETDWLHKQGKLELHVKYQPNLRTVMVADDGREFDDLAFMWMEWNGGRFRLEDAKLDEKRCREFWTWLGRTDPVPKSLELFINADDMQRIFPKGSK